MPGPIAATRSSGRRAEFQPHPPDPILDNALHRSPPSGVKGGHDAPPAVGHQHRHAVGSLDSQQNSRPVGHQSVALAKGLSLVAGCGPPNDHHARVDLSQHRQRRSTISGYWLRPASRRLRSTLSRSSSACKPKIQLTGSTVRGIGAADNPPRRVLNPCQSHGISLPGGNRQPLHAVGRHLRPGGGGESSSKWPAEILHGAHTGRFFPPTPDQAGLGK